MYFNLKGWLIQGKNQYSVVFKEIGKNAETRLHPNITNSWVTYKASLSSTENTLKLYCISGTYKGIQVYFTLYLLLREDQNECNF